MRVFLLFPIMLLVSTPAWAAFKTPCQLQQTEVDSSLPISVGAVGAYQDRLAKECVLHQRSSDLQSRAGVYGIKLENIGIYQGLRYIDRYSYFYASQDNTPLEVVFQVDNSLKSRPVAERSTLVWRNWVRGIGQIDEIKNLIVRGGKIDLKVLGKVHSGFFIENEDGENSHDGQKAGTIKPLNTGLISWDIKTPQLVASHVQSIRQVNQNLAEMGLLPNKLETKLDEELNRLLDVRDDKLFPGHPDANPYHLRNLFRFMNKMFVQAAAGNHMVWNDRIMTPAQFAYFVQQYIVQIHAFHDGNGRTSRFWQDTILSLFALPYGASGDLVNDDMLSTANDYYDLALAASRKQLQDVEFCLNEVYPLYSGDARQQKPADLRTISPLAIPFNCRLVK